MAPINQLSYKNIRSKTSEANALTVEVALNKKIFALLMLTSLMAVVFLLASTQALADENLYAKNYKEQNSYQLKSQNATPDTKMFVSNHKEDDNISMLEKGYDMMGSSGFNAADVPADQALQHAKAIKADTVLVYSKYGSAKTSAGKLEFIKEAAKNGGEIDAKALEEEPTQYDYYASYWAKLPPPLLGVHVIKLIKASDNAAEKAKNTAEQGLKVIAVIKESPAAAGNMLKGDTLLKIGTIALVKAEDLMLAVKEYAGKTVPIELERDGAKMKLTVALNARK